jgi:glycerophosphoryl diester phosphodiesterase
LSQFSLASASRPLAFAHRGGSGLRPENTLAAFDHGLALGADGLELDVHLSRDGIVVVHHDTTLERTTNGRGHIAALTADELDRIDAGYWFTAHPGGAADDYPFRGQGLGIPRFRAVLARYAGTPLIVELKAATAELARRAVDDVRAAGALDRVVFGSFFDRALAAVREYEPRLRTGSGREETRWALYRSRLRWPLGATRYREFQVPVKAGATTVVSKQFIAHAHRAGLPVRVWTIDDPTEMEQLLNWGADSIISDRPDLAVPVVREWSARNARGAAS